MFALFDSFFFNKLNQKEYSNIPKIKNLKKLMTDLEETKTNKDTSVQDSLQTHGKASVIRSFFILSIIFLNILEVLSRR